MIVEIGDLHIREEEPHATVFKNFTKWLTSNYSNCTFIFTGDVFNSYRPTNREIEIALDFFCNQLKGEVYIVRGNHDYKSRVSALDVLKPFKRLHVIEQPTFEEIEGTNYLFLPWLWSKVDQDWPSMREYEKGGKLESLLAEQTFDHSKLHVVGHFSDVPLFDTEFDISWIPGTKCLGHVHRYGDGKNFIGVPYLTRGDEKGQTCRIYVDRQETIVPPFLEYDSVEYGKLPITKQNVETIYDVLNAPDVQTAKEFYKDYFLRRIQTVHKKEIVVSNNKNSTQKKSITFYLDHFIESNKLDKEIEKDLKELIHD